MPDWSQSLPPCTVSLCKWPSVRISPTPPLELKKKWQTNNTKRNCCIAFDFMRTLLPKEEHCSGMCTCPSYCIVDKHKTHLTYNQILVVVMMILIIGLVYGDIDCKVSILAKMLRHCSLKYQTVITWDHTSNTLVNTSGLCFPCELAAMPD